MSQRQTSHQIQLLIPLFFWGIIISIFIACDKSKATSQSEIKDPPNILLILTDDQGWGDLSINGNKNLNTPNIDRLGKGGAILDRFYVSPVCSPTRAAILTGRYAVRCGVYSTSQGGERIDLDETTIAEVFKKAGYRTGAFGKWHSGMQYPYHPNGRGFEEFYGFCSGHWGNYIDPMLEHNGELVQGEGFLPDDLTNKAMNFIEKYKDQPFFAYIPYNTPHSPMQMPDKWWSQFEDKELTSLGEGSKPERLLHTRAALALVENIDWNIGRLIKKLQELQLEEKTIIIFLSDNGPNGARWNGGMKGTKGTTDEGGVRSPTFIQWKGVVPAGRKIEEIASAIDLLPTLTELTGISYSTNKPLDGKSLKPLLLEKNPRWEDRLVFNHWKGKLSIRNQRFRLDKDNQLFDMHNDSGQKVDVSEQFPTITESLIQAKEAWQETVAIELPQKDERSFPIGHPDFSLTQIPARDGHATGTIQRSNRWPNCSYFTNWTDTKDKITWEVEILTPGNYEVTLYYTCAPENVGGKFALQMNTSQLLGEITTAHDPPLLHLNTYRSKMEESYSKRFKPLKMGKIFLKQGKGELSLQALHIPGKELMDFRLMMLRKLE